MNNRAIFMTWALAFNLLIGGMLWPVTATGNGGTAFTLEQLVQTALQVSIALKTKAARVQQRHAEKVVARSNYFPTLKTTYAYEKESYPSYSYRTLTDPDSDYTWTVAFEQTIYSPNRLTNNMQLADWQLEKARLEQALQAREIALKVLKAYFSFLRNSEQLEIARKQVEQITVHERKSQAFFDTGKIPLNELLQAGVRLANARQEVTVAENRLALAETSVNLLLRRPLEIRLMVREWLDTSNWTHCLKDCLAVAMQKRVERKLADSEIGMARTQLKMARNAYLPTLNLEGFYYRKGTEADLEDKSNMSHPDGWQVQAELGWTIWSGNRRPRQVDARQASLSQSRLAREALLDTIGYEVREAYLELSEAHRNIEVMKAALGQAEENLRLNQGRFDQQLASTTDVLDAQALLTVTRGRYVASLYDDQVARASLKHAMALNLLESAESQFSDYQTP